jgi:hypothetical protein
VRKVGREEYEDLRSYFAIASPYPFIQQCVLGLLKLSLTADDGTSMLEGLIGSETGAASSSSPKNPSGTDDRSGRARDTGASAPFKFNLAYDGLSWQTV